MKRIWIVLFILVAYFQSVSAKKLLGDIDLGIGEWEMVGVSLHNYKMLDIQDEVGTFILRDEYVLKQIQEKWDFEEVFEDYCDYHYALKFYKDGILMKTLRVNLFCNYITDGAFSYKFSTKEFAEHKRYYKPIRWSRIRFKDTDLLQATVGRLENMKGVYWYGDVKQYRFDGEFSIEVGNLPWNANRDSVVAVVTSKLQDELGRDDFYITVKYWRLSEDWEKMRLRLNVFCNQDFYKIYTDTNVITRWRSHFSEQSFIQIVVIGMSKEEYFNAMNYN